MHPFEFREPLGTDRLTLRLLTVDDVDAVHAYRGREDVARYQLSEPRTRDQVAERIVERAALRRLEHDGDHLQLGVERREDGRLIGDLYFSIRSTANATAEVGWSLHPDAQGSGYATEGATALLRLAFDTLGLHRVVAELDPRNTASARLCDRLGMRREALFAQDLWFKAAWADTEVHAILEHEWRAGR